MFPLLSRESTHRAFGGSDWADALFAYVKQFGQLRNCCPCSVTALRSRFVDGVPDSKHYSIGSSRPAILLGMQFKPHPSLLSPVGHGGD
jgi:hypothetical protein